MMLYYMDSDEKFISKSHKISLVPGLNPTVTFSRSETKLLGKPFTSCSHDKNYSQRTCENHKYMNHVIKKCNCYPRFNNISSSVSSLFFFSYDQDYIEFVPSHIKPCNFFQQSTCIATLHNSFNQAKFTEGCVPPCSHREIHQEGTSVSFRLSF